MNVMNWRQLILDLELDDSLDGERRWLYLTGLSEVDMDPNPM